MSTDLSPAAREGAPAYPRAGSLVGGQYLVDRVLGVGGMGAAPCTAGAAERSHVSGGLRGAFCGSGACGNVCDNGICSGGGCLCSPGFK